MGARPQCLLCRVGLACLLGVGGMHAPRTAHASEHTELEGLLALLDHQTEIATRTGLNGDYTPGIVTILDGDDLLARGARDVWEALALVPGLNLSLEVTGERQVLSRGVGHGYASGNIKVLLDGVSMNSTLLGTAEPVMRIPIEQVERIEAIRGPGSSIYGEYAYAGVVNVITRSTERNLHAQAGGTVDYGGGAIWHWSHPARDLEVSLNLAGLEGAGGEIDVDADALHPIGLSELSFAPGPVNDDQRFGSLFARLHWGEYFAALTLLDASYGDHFGINHFLPPGDNGLATRQFAHTLEIGRAIDLADALSAQIRLETGRRGNERSGLYVMPAGFAGIEEDVSMDRDYRETYYRARGEFHWRAGRRHEVLAGLEATRTRVDWATWNWRGLEIPASLDWLDSERERTIYSAFVQDEFALGERLTLTGTLRYDDYSEVDDSLSPRFGAVWRLDDDQVLKAQYALAFRPPTFFELQHPAEGSLESGEIATFELGYVLRRPRWTARLTAFHSDLTGPILFDEISEDGYINGPDTRLQGLECEYQHRLGRHFKLDANLSYVDAERRGRHEPLPGGTDLLANAALYWRPHPAWTAVLQGRYVGDRDRRPGDARADVDDYTLLDLTLSYRRDGPGPYAYLGVKNLTDAEVRYPDQLTSLGGVSLIYPDDYPRPERRVWLSVGLDF